MYRALYLCYLSMALCGRSQAEGGERCSDVPNADHGKTWDTEAAGKNFQYEASSEGEQLGQKQAGGGFLDNRKCRQESAQLDCTSEQCQAS